jgi:hypothetical protein
MGVKRKSCHRTTKVRNLDEDLPSVELDPLGEVPRAREKFLPRRIKRFQ